MLNSCYEMTFFNRKSQRTFTCQIVQNAKRHLKGAKTMQISGIGHSVIRGLGTTGQWFSASTTVYPRGSPQGRRHSYFVDCWTFISRLALSRCRPAAQMYIDSLNTIHCVKICGSRTKPRSGAKHPWRTDFYAICSIKESCTRNVICHHTPDKTSHFSCHSCLRDICLGAHCNFKVFFL